MGRGKGNSLVNKQTPGAGAPQPSHPNTTSPSPWSRGGYPAELSDIHRTPSEAGLLIQYGGLGYLRQPGLEERKAGRD